MKTPNTHTHKHGCRLWAVQTVVVRLSRKITVTYRLRAQRRLSQLMAIMLTSISSLALALPTGAELVAGQASISTPTANSMVVNQATNKAILNWQTFNIGTGQSVQFVQPSVTSVALNRVVGNQASSIYGSLTANGQVFLINPAGVMFAPGAQVNVGGLIASSLGISNENFLAGQYIFTGNDGGAVENYGNIRTNGGGYVVLAAPTVNNAGSIDANGGAIGLLAGSRVTIDNSGAGLVKFSVDAAAAQAAIVNSGTMTADGGHVAVLASTMGDAMATVINQTGVIRANSAVESNGVITLSGGSSGVVKVAGTLQAAGADDGLSGGTVKILGDKVALLDGARIDVTGKAGGGTALVGGDYQGKGTDQNASKTLVSSGAIIDASATSSGNGGKVVVWADDTTRFYGDIKATGGALAGDGGFVEVSGKQALDLHGSIDVAAPAGIGGKVLLDPQDIVLNATVQAAPPNNANGTPDVAFADAPNPGTYTIEVADVTGYSELFLQASRDITLASAMTMAAGNSVRLEAGNNITTNAGATLTVTGTGSINLKADADSSGTGTLALGAAVSSQAGGITLSGASVTSTAAGTIASTGAANSDAGQLTITSSGIVNLAGAITATGGAAGAGLTGRTGGTVNVTGVGGVTTAGISASGSTGGAGNTAGGNAGSITVANSGSGDITTGALTVSTGSAVGTGASGTVGSIAVNNTAAAGNATTGAITTTGGTKGDGGNITLSALGSFASGNIISSGGTTITGNAGRNAGTVSITGAGINLGASTINANGSAGLGTSQTGGAGGAVTLTSTAGITQTSAINANGATGSATDGAGGNAGSITVSNTVAGNISLGALTVSTGAAVGTGAGGTAGSIAVNNTAAAGSTTTGVVTTTGGTKGNGGNIALSALGTLASGNIISSGGTTITGNAGRNAGTISLTGGGINLGASTITASGSAGLGTSQTGGAGGAVTLTSTAGITQTGTITASGAAGSATDGSGGNAGSITVSNTVAGNISLGALTASTGAAVGAGAGGTVGSIGVTNNATSASLGTGNLSTAGAAGGNGGNITLASQGDVTVTGTLNTSGTVLAAGTRAGSNAGNITITGINRSVSSTVTASGSAANGVSQAGGNAGTVSITGTGTLNTAAVTAQSGAATAGGAGGNAGSITLSGSTVANSGALTTSGGTNGAGGAVNITSQGTIGLNSIAAAFGAGSAVRGDVTLLAGGAITQTGAIVAGNLNATTANAAGSAITLSNAGNDAQNINLQVRDGTVAAVGSNNAAAAISYRDSNAVVVTGINNGAGAGGNLTLTTAGAITQTGAIIAGNTSITAGAANNITLQNAGNDFSGPVTVVSGLNVNLADANDLALGTSTVSGTLNVNNAGAITQTGALVVTGLTTLAAGTANDITLTNAANNFSTLAIASANNASVLDSNALIIGTSTVNNSLTLVAGNTITQTGAITTPTLSAKTLLNAGAAITLTNAGNDVTNVDLRARNGADTANVGGAISYTDASALNVAAAQTTSTVTLIAGDVLTQSGAIAASTLTATTRNNAGAAITLNNSANDVTTANLQVLNLAGTANAAAAIAYTDANAVAISGINNGTGTGGNVTLNAGGSVTQTGAINTAMLAANLTGAASSLTLGTAGNNIAQLSNITTPGGFTLANGNNAVNIAGAISTTNTGVSISSGTAATTFTTGGSIASTGGNVVLTNTNASKVLGNIDTTGGASTGNFTITGAGAISQQAGTALKVKGTTTIAAGAGNNVILTESGNDFTGAVAIASALNVGLTDSNALALGTSVVSGTLDVNAAGAVTQTGGLTVTGLTTLAAGTANDITLNNAANNFSTVAIASANNASVVDSNALIIGTSTVNNSLALVAGGAITQTGAITAPTLSAKTLLTGGAAITLTNAGNDVTNVDLRARNTGDTANAAGAISYTDASALNVAAAQTTSTVTLIAGDTLTQSGAIAASTLTATTRNNAGAAITLNNSANDVTTANLQARDLAGTANAAAAIAYTDANAVAISGINNGTGTGGNVTLNAGGAITQTGAITATTLTAKTLLNAGAAITLTNAGNDVTNVDLRARNTGDTANAAGAISYTDASALNVAAAQTTSTVTLIAGDTLTQSGAIAASTLTATTRNNAGAAITLNNSANDVTTANLQVLNLAGTANAAAAIAYTDANAVAISGINNGTGTGGNVTLNAGGAITQSGAINTAMLAANLTGAASSLTLGTAGNNIAQLSNITTPGGFTLVNGNNAVNIAGAINTTNTGVSISSGTAATTFTAGGSIASTGGNVVLTNTNASKVLGNIDTTGGASTGNFTVTGAGAISQQAGTALKVKGTTTIAAGATNNVIMTEAGNDFGGAVAIGSALNVAVTDSSALALGTSVVSGTLDVNATGAVTQTGGLTVTGLTTLAAGTTNDITLNNAANNFSTVAIASANNASVVDSNALIVGTSTVNNSLALVAGGAITQTGAIVTPSLSAKTLLTGGAAITLTNAGNDVTNVDLRARNTGDTANAAGAISYTDASALNVAAAQTTSTVTLIAGDTLTQSGAIAASTLTATTRNNAGAAITLNNSANDVTTANLQARDLAGTANAAAAIAYTDANAVAISGINNGTGTGGNVTLNAGGAITQTGAITAATLSAKTLVDAGAAITLTNAGNDVTTLDLSARNVADTANANGAISYTDASNFNIANVATTGALTLQSNGNISQSGAVTAASLAISSTGAGAVNLGTQANTIATLNAITAAGGFALDNGNTNLAVAGNINTTNSAVSIATGTGSYTQNTNIDIVAGSAPITVTADTVTINANAGNNALTTSGVLTLKPTTAGRAMSLAGASAFDLSAAELTALATGATGTIVIGDTASTGAMTIGSAVNLAGKTLTLNAGSITDAGVNTITASNITLNANGQIGSSNADGIDIAATNLSVNTVGNADAFIRSSAINLGAGSSGSNVGSGTLDIVATGAVTQTAGTGNITAGNLNVKTLSAGIADIVLNNSANDVATINLQTRNVADTGNASGAIQYNGSGGFDVATVATGGNASLSAGGAMTQSGAIAASTLTATTRNNAGAAITLNNSANDVTTANLQVLNLAGTANAAAAIAYTDANAVAISGINNGTGTGGNVTLNAGGAITQSGAINTAMLAANLTGAASSLTLGTAGNNIAQLSNITTPGGFTLVNGNNAVNIAGAINTTNTGVSISSGTAATTFTAGGSIASTGGNVVLTNTNASKVLGNIDTTGGASTGNFTVTGAGAISQQAGTALKVKGTTTIAAGATNNVIMTEAGNDFGGAVAIGSALNVAVTDSSALALGTSVVSGTLDVNATGAVTQTGGLTVTGLTTLAAGTTNDITLNNAANNFSTVAIASANNASVVDSNALIVGTSTVNNSLALVAGGAITQTGAIVTPSLSAKTLLTGGAAITLTNAGNDVTNVDLRARNTGDTANAAGAISYTDASALNVAAAQTTSTVTLIAGDTLTQSGAIAASTLTATTRNNAGAAITLNNSANDVTNVDLRARNTGDTANAAGAIAYTDASALNVAAAQTTNTVTLIAGDTLTQSGAIAASTLTATTRNNAGAAITFDNSANDVTTANLQVRDSAGTANAPAAITYTDANAVAISGINNGTGTGGNVTLNAGGAVTQSGGIVAAGLALGGVGGDYTLRHVGNDVTTLAANTSAIDYSQTNALIVGTVGATSGVSTTGAAKIETTGSSANLTLNNAVTSGASGDAIVLKAGSSNAAGVATGGQFINTVGAGGLTASAGRYLVYSGDPGTSTEGVSGYSKRYNSDTTYTPGGTANMFMYRIAPTLTITADNTTRVYGQSNPVFTGSASGFIDGDTATSVGVSRSSTAVFNTPVAAGPATITVAAINNENYTLALSNGQMSISKAPISNVTGITAADKTFDGNVSATLNTASAGFNGIVAGDVLTVGAATGTFDTAAIGAGKTVQINGITLASAAAANYTLADNTATTTASVTGSSPAASSQTTLSLNSPQVVAATKLQVTEMMNSLFEKTPAASVENRGNSTECAAGSVKDGSNQGGGC